MRRIAGYTWTDYKTNTQIAKELKIIPILDKILEYKRNWIQHVNRMPRNRLPRVIKHYSPTGRRNHPNWQKESWQTFEETYVYVRPERVNKWPTPWQIYDDDGNDHDHDDEFYAAQIYTHVTVFTATENKITPTAIQRYIWATVCFSDSPVMKK